MSEPGKGEKQSSNSASKSRGVGKDVQGRRIKSMRVTSKDRRRRSGRAGDSEQQAPHYEPESRMKKSKEGDEHARTSKHKAAATRQRRAASALAPKGDTILKEQPHKHASGSRDRVRQKSKDRGEHKLRKRGDPSYPGRRKSRSENDPDGSGKGTRGKSSFVSSQSVVVQKPSSRPPHHKPKKERRRRRTRGGVLPPDDLPPRDRPSISGGADILLPDSPLSPQVKGDDRKKSEDADIDQRASKEGRRRRRNKSRDSKGNREAMDVAEPKVVGEVKIGARKGKEGVKKKKKRSSAHESCLETSAASTGNLHPDGEVPHTLEENTSKQPSKGKAASEEKKGKRFRGKSGGSVGRASPPDSPHLVGGNGVDTALEDQPSVKDPHRKDSSKDSKEDLRGRFKRFASSKSVAVVRKGSAKHRAKSEEMSDSTSSESSEFHQADMKLSKEALSVLRPKLDKPSKHVRNKSRIFGAKKAKEVKEGAEGQAAVAPLPPQLLVNSYSVKPLEDNRSAKAEAALADLKKKRVVLIGRVAEVEGREQAATAKDAELMEKELRLRRVEGRITELQMGLQAREDAIVEKESVLGALQASLASEKAALDARELALNEMETSLQAQERKLAEQSAALRTREKDVEVLARQTNELQARLTASAVHAKVAEAEACILRGKTMTVQASRLANVERLDYLEGIPRSHVLRMQSMVRFYLLHKKWNATVQYVREGDAKEVRRLRNRSRAIQEAVDTERSYVEALTECVMLYLARLEKSGLASLEDCHAIFGNMRAILAVNTKFLGDLEARWKLFPRSQQLSQEFISFVPLLDVYKPFVQGFDIATKRLAALKASNAAFKEFVEGLHGTKNLPLSGYLIQPVQRLARYDILLKEILKNTPKYHVDYDGLVEARNLIREKVLWVDEEKDNMDHYRQAQEIRKKQHLVRDLHEVVLVNNGVYPHNLMMRESVPMHHLLIVEVVGAKDLPAMDGGKTSDPFLILTVGSQQAKTKVVKKTLAPRWQAKFVFEVDNQNQSLLIDCWDWNRMSKSDYMCSCEIPICTILEELSGTGLDMYPLHKYPLKSPSDTCLNISTLPPTGSVGLSFQLVTVASAPSPRKANGGSAYGSPRKARKSIDFGGGKRSERLRESNKGNKVRHSEALIRGSSEVEDPRLPALSFKGRAPKTAEEMAEFKAYQIKKYELQQADLAAAQAEASSSSSQEESVLHNSTLGLEGAFPKSMDRRAVSVAGLRGREQERDRVHSKKHSSRKAERAAAKAQARRSSLTSTDPAAVGSVRVSTIRTEHKDAALSKNVSVDGLWEHIPNAHPPRQRAKKRGKGSGSNRARLERKLSDDCMKGARPRQAPLHRKLSDEGLSSPGNRSRSLRGTIAVEEPGDAALLIVKPQGRSRSRSTVHKRTKLDGIKRDAAAPSSSSDGNSTKSPRALPVLPVRDTAESRADKEQRRAERRKRRAEKKRRQEIRALKRSRQEDKAKRKAKQRKRREDRRRRKALEESNARFEESRSTRSADEPLPLPGDKEEEGPALAEDSEFTETTVGSTSTSMSSSKTSSEESEGTESWDEGLEGAGLVVADGQSSTPAPQTVAKPPAFQIPSLRVLTPNTLPLPRAPTVVPPTPDKTAEEPVRLPKAFSLDGEFPKSLERRAVSVKAIRQSSNAPSERDRLLARPPPPMCLPTETLQMRKGPAPLPPVPAPPPSFLAKANVAYAMYAFAGVQAGDLSFAAGEKVMITRREGAWWRGFCVNEAGERRFGVFPYNYIQVQKDENGHDKEIEIRVFASNARAPGK